MIFNFYVQKPINYLTLDTVLDTRYIYKKWKKKKQGMVISRQTGNTQKISVTLGKYNVSTGAVGIKTEK